MSILSERLKYFVEQKGYSIADLAGRSGIERATLYQYLKGSRPLKNHVHLETLMAELQLTPDERQEVLEAYEITQIGQVQYNRRCKVREILNSLLTASREDFCGSETGAGNVSADGRGAAADSGRTGNQSPCQQHHLRKCDPGRRTATPYPARQ